MIFTEPQLHKKKVTRQTENDLMSIRLPKILQKYFQLFLKISSMKTRNEAKWENT